ncbi:hypothetical protein ACP70R_015501 [Stipagrostis hirtigluma subsp. patula]
MAPPWLPLLPSCLMAISEARTSTNVSDPMEVRAVERQLAAPSTNKPAAAKWPYGASVGASKELLPPSRPSPSVICSARWAPHAGAKHLPGPHDGIARRAAAVGGESGGDTNELGGRCVAVP